MAELTQLYVQPSFLGQDMFTSREVRDVPTSTNRYGRTTKGYREYAVSSESQPAFVARLEAKHAPKPSKRQKIVFQNPAITYVTERNAKRREIDIPIIVAEAAKLINEGENE